MCTDITVVVWWFLYKQFFLISFFMVLAYIFPTEQCHFLLLAHLVKPLNAYVDWDNQTAVEIDRQYRALGEMVSNIILSNK